MKKTCDICKSIIKENEKHFAVYCEPLELLSGKKLGELSKKWRHMDCDTRKWNEERKQR